MKDLSTLDRADIVRALMNMRDEIDNLLKIVLPDAADQCPHPQHLIEHEETMDDEPTPYRCKQCGATQDEPFHPQGD